jgi:hypothetical protein
LPETSTGRFVGSNGDRALVLLDDGSRVSLRIVGSYMPQPDDIVRISRDDRGTVVDGLATPRQPVGTILSLGTRQEGKSTVPVADVRTVDQKTQTVEILDHVIDPKPGDVVVVLAGFIIGRRRAPSTKEN